jgi:signal transduction histidine kinase
MSKANEPSIENKLESVDLSTLTEEVFNNYVEQAKAKKLALTLDMPDEPVTAGFVPKIFKLVMSNLLSNAVKYTEAGSIRVKLSSVNGKTQLSVEDSGIGIPEAETDKLFTPFFRASNAVSGGMRGSGVGLASIHRYATQFGADLDVVSKEGEGSTFTLTLQA